MRLSGRNIAVILVSGLFLIGIGTIGYKLFLGPRPTPPTPPSNYAKAGKSLSEFQDELAKMALDQLHNMPGLGVRPTDAEVPIGTLFIPGRSLDLDEDSCRADPPPAAYAANMFPDFQVQNAVAASVGLSPAVTRSLVNGGAQIAEGDAVTIHFDTLKRQYLDDHKLAELLKRPACVAAISDGPVAMIRGYFRGQRSFVLSTTGAGKLNANLAKIGNFEVSRGAGNSSVTLKDPSDFGFLQLYTEVALKPVKTSTVAVVPVPPEPTPTVYPGKPASHKKHSYHPNPPAPSTSTAVTTAVVQQTSVLTVTAAQIAATGRVYIQRDVLDKSHADASIVAALSHAGFPVVSKIETIPTRKMPTLAQVRYFNATDLASATRALAILRQFFPNAQLERIALPSPQGQLEVWLPKSNG